VLNGHRRPGEALAIVKVQGRQGAHYGYESAENSLCLEPIFYVGRRRQDGDEVSCTVCMAAFELLVEQGVEALATRCHGFTRKGDRCTRDPQPGSLYCPSHRQEGVLV
jgi:hypothetical protein